MHTPTAWINLTGLTIRILDDTGFHVTTLEADPLPAMTMRAEERRGLALVNETEVLAIERRVGHVQHLPPPDPEVGLVVLHSAVEAAGFSRVDLWEPFDVLPSGSDGGINCRGLIRHRLA